MSWFSKHFGITLDSHSLGNLIKDASPAAALVGGPLGIALAGGLSTLGDLGRGKNIGQAIKGSVGNAALGAGVGSLATHGFLGSGLQGFAGGTPASAVGSAAGSVAAPTADAAGTAAGGAGGLSSVASSGGLASAAPAPITDALSITPSSSALSLAPTGGFPAIDGSAIHAATLPAFHAPQAGLLSRVGGFLKNNPEVVDLASREIPTALSGAQVGALNANADATRAATARTQAQDKALDPFRAGLLGTLGTRLTTPVSRNPYLPAPVGG